MKQLKAHFYELILSGLVVLSGCNRMTDNPTAPEKTNGSLPSTTEAVAGVGIGAAVYNIQVPMQPLRQR